MRSLIAKVAGYIRKRARSWARRRQGKDRDPVTLESRRIYILPTRFGFVYGAVLFAMLLAAMNYGNSMAFMLTFLLAGLALVAMHHCHRNMSGLVIRFAGAEPVFAGQDASFEITVENPSPGKRYELLVDAQGSKSETVDLKPGEHGRLKFSVAGKKRGVLRLERLNVSTRYPFRLFRAWSWIYMDLECLVYPAPAPRGPQPPVTETDTGGAQDKGSGVEDFAGLRSYRPGDSPRHIAWKALAKEQELLVKQYTGTAVETRWFEWETVPSRDMEDRLARLCRWIVDAHDDHQAYGLRMPAVAIEPNLGTAHRRRCLSELALFNAVETA